MFIHWMWQIIVRYMWLNMYYLLTKCTSKEINFTSTPKVSNYCEDARPKVHLLPYFCWQSYWEMVPKLIISQCIIGLSAHAVYMHRTTEGHFCFVGYSREWRHSTWLALQMFINEWYNTGKDFLWHHKTEELYM